MEFWPSASTKDTQSQQKKGKGRDKTVENRANYPVIDHGSLSAATLVKINGKLEWRTAFSSQRGMSENLYI